jgi:hypothetical protein
LARSSFAHAFNKACQYACNDIKIYVGFREEGGLKAIQSTLQKQVHGQKSLAKGAMNGIEHALMLGFPIEN